GIDPPGFCIASPRHGIDARDTNHGRGMDMSVVHDVKGYPALKACKGEHCPGEPLSNDKHLPVDHDVNIGSATDADFWIGIPGFPFLRAEAVMPGPGHKND